MHKKNAGPCRIKCVALRIAGRILDNAHITKHVQVPHKKEKNDLLFSIYHLSFAWVLERFSVIKQGFISVSLHCLTSFMPHDEKKNILSRCFRVKSGGCHPLHIVEANILRKLNSSVQTLNSAGLEAAGSWKRKKQNKLVVSGCDERETREREREHTLHCKRQWFNRRRVGEINTLLDKHL